MNELKDLRPPVVHTVEREARRGEELIGSIAPKPGHSIFKFTASGELTKVEDHEYAEQVLTLGGAPTRKLIRERGAIYFPALNLKNAARKLKKAGIAK